MDLNKLIFELPKGTFKAEKDFSQWFGRQVKDRWGICYKLSDESRGMKPRDSSFFYDWLAGAIEFKIIKQKSFKPFYLLRGSKISIPGFQVKWLTLAHKNGWLWLVCVYNPIEHIYVLINFGALLLDPDLVIWEKGIPFKTSIVVN